jgi:hypothetical protein
MAWKPKAENDQPNHHLVKSATPITVFRPQGSGIEPALATPEPKTSLSPGIHETEKNKMFKQAQASVGTTMVVANPLFDSDDTNLCHPSRRLTSSMLYENQGIN